MSESGLSPTAIGRAIGVPRPTVRDWIAGRTPRQAREETGPVCDRCGSRHEVLEPAPAPFVYLLGLYLGDGSISSHPRAVYRLRIFLDAAYPGIIESAEQAMNAVMPKSSVHRVRKKGCVEVSSYSKLWPCLFPQHGPGVKHDRPIVLDEWQLRLVRRHPDLLLRGLIHSDGCRFINTGRRGWRHPRYSFRNRSDDILGIFCDACDLVGVRWTTTRHTVYVSRKADVALLDTFIGPKA